MGMIRWRKSSQSLNLGNCAAAAADWAKSSHSVNGECVEWAKSTHSTNNGECAEVRTDQGMVLVRDSKDKDGPVLAFTPAEWEAFITQVKAL